MPGSQQPPIVAAFSLSALLQPPLLAIESIGIGSQQALREIDCSAGEIEQGNIDFFDIQFRLLDYGRRMSGNPLFAIYAGGFARPEHLGVFGLLLKSGPTLENSLHQTSRILPTLPKPFSILRLRRTQNGMEIEIPPDCFLDDESSSLVTEHIFSFIYRCSPLVTGWPMHVERVAFSHAPATCISKYEDHFQCKVSFNAGADKFTTVVDARKPLCFTNPALFLELDSMFSRLAALTATQDNRAAEIRKLIAAEIATQRPSEQDIAGRLSISESTLRRWLSACGTTFQKELDITLRDMAMQMLDDGTREIKNIATTLGYSEASAFHRAFKRWTGVTPAQYKNKNLR